MKNFKKIILSLGLFGLVGSPIGLLALPEEVVASVTCDEWVKNLDGVLLAAPGRSVSFDMWPKMERIKADVGSVVDAVVSQVSSITPQYKECSAELAPVIKDFLVSIYKGMEYNYLCFELAAFGRDLATTDAFMDEVVSAEMKREMSEYSAAARTAKDKIAGIIKKYAPAATQAAQAIVDSLSKAAFECGSDRDAAEEAMAQVPAMMQQFIVLLAISKEDLADIFEGLQDLEVSFETPEANHFSTESRSFDVGELDGNQAVAAESKVLAPSRILFLNPKAACVYESQRGLPCGSDCEESATLYCGVYERSSNTLYTNLVVQHEDSLNMVKGIKGYIKYSAESLDSVPSVLMIGSSVIVKAFSEYPAASRDAQASTSSMANDSHLLQDKDSFIVGLGTKHFVVSWA